MDNYLSPRWPGGPAAPPPASSPSPPRKKRRWKRGLLIAILCAVAVAVLIGSSYWSVSRLEDYLASLPSASDNWDEDPAYSRRVTHWDTETDDWTADDLPWGDPDPSVHLSLSTTADQVLSAQEIYRQVLPSVVCVETETDSGYSVGSGVIMSENGYIITNYHVIEKGLSIKVMLLSDESTYSAVVIGFDEEMDIAILKIDADGLTPADFVDSDELSVGDLVYAIGNPMGYLYGSITDGIVSALARGVEVSGNNMTLIQTSAALNPGNSGGALVNACGQVVGITSAKITGVEDDTVIEGLGLAIPITDVRPFIDHILSTGVSFRPALGITCTVDKTSDPKGIRVIDVTPGTPAVGLLHKNDLITAANGVPVTELYQLSRILYETGVGGEVELTVQRGTRTLTVAITLYDRLAEE